MRTFLKYLILSALALLAAPTTAKQPPIATPMPAGSPPEPRPAKSADDEPAIYDLRQFTCPLGGEKFSHDVGYMAYPLLTLPDGSWLGDHQIGAQVPVCPGNGLVLLPDYDPFRPEAQGFDRLTYVDYSPAEIARLPALIADPEYRALAAQGRYVQAWWIAAKLGRPAYGRFHLLQRSTWATRDPSLRKILVERFVAEVPALIEAAQVPPEGKFMMQAFLANALRELGRFDEAMALIDPLADSIAAQERLEVTPFYRAIAERDEGRIPAEMAPSRIFGDLCRGELVQLYGPLTEGTRRGCKVRQEREAQEAADQEAAIELNSDRPSRARMCAATPSAKRTRAQEIACEDDQRDKDSRAGLAMLSNGSEVARQCGDRPDLSREGALLYACISYRSALSSELGKLLARDEAAWAILCPEGEVDSISSTDRAAFVDEACRKARDVRRQLGAERLLTNPAALAELCAEPNELDYLSIEERACGMYYDLEVQRLAEDPAAFDAACARYGKILADRRGSVDEQGQRCSDAFYLRRNQAAKRQAEAKGKRCLGGADYSRDLPRCLTPAEYDKEQEMAERAKLAGPMSAAEASVEIQMDPTSSLSLAARAQAERIVAQAKIDKTYPKRQPGDREF